MFATRRPAATLPELLIALLLLAVLGGLAAPRLARAADLLAARAARETLAAGLLRTRMAAVAGGGARLVVEPAAGTFRVTTTDGDVVLTTVRLAADYGIAISVDGRRADSVVIEFDGLGLGRIASRTIRLRRGAVETGLTISSYGRVRRW